jgi:hypothetical protein
VIKLRETNVNYITLKNKFLVKMENNAGIKIREIKVVNITIKVLIGK